MQLHMVFQKSARNSKENYPLEKHGIPQTLGTAVPSLVCSDSLIFSQIFPMTENSLYLYSVDPMLITSFCRFVISSSPLADFGSATMENITRAKIPSTVQVTVVLVSIIIIVAQGCFYKAAAAGTPNPCGSSAASLSVCLPAVQGDDPPLPTDACCVAVRSTDAGCLCAIVGEYSSAISSMGVNVSAALLLPKNCKHVLPLGYHCDGYDFPSHVPQHRRLMNV